MEILAYEKSVWGKINIYVHDQKMAHAIERLTGKKTIDQDDISALLYLGIKVNVLKLPA